MEFFRRCPAQPSRLGILPGTFNPVTVAHLALAQAAAGYVDEVLFVLPRMFPHKQYAGAIFVDIANECRAAYGAAVRLTFLCGRDAAERIAGWDYGAPSAFGEMLRH